MACVCFVVCDDVVDDDNNNCYSNSTFNDLNQTHSTVCGSMHWLLLYIFWIWNIIKSKLTHFMCTVRLWPFTFLILSHSRSVCASLYVVFSLLSSATLSPCSFFIHFILITIIFVQNYFVCIFSLHLTYVTITQISWFSAHTHWQCV